MEQKTATRPQPGTTPMNLTCAANTNATATATGTQVYAIVFNPNGTPEPPDNTWSPLSNFSPGTVAYVMRGTDFHGNSGHCDLSGSNIGIFTKTI